MTCEKTVNAQPVERKAVLVEVVYNDGTRKSYENFILNAAQIEVGDLSAIGIGFASINRINLPQTVALILCAKAFENYETLIPVIKKNNRT